ncbi:putative mur ligase [Lyophyllum shimeji]|uniref:Mur ligase n=1 Tax=Lyophyllum shimeji TaxID=47721 RepID=A0A9P3UUZ5_LYOSH|nr:putative mur ligase [Lyophyllum shimeji]
MSIDLSLDRLQRLVQHLPPYTRPTFHIAGTNGKGSVSAILTSILRNSSPPLSVGRYNSPHLVSIYDCIVINGEPVDPDVYATARTHIERVDAEHNTRLSNFELLTLTALSIFEQARVDFVVLEVGMGGRLDATNIIPDEAVLLSALTAVDLDHQMFLGNTVEDIAREKAAIARKGRPFVLGSQRHAAVAGVVREVLEQIGADLVPSLQVVKRDWDDRIDGPPAPAFSLKSASDFKEPPPQAVKVHMPCFSRELHALLPLYGNHQLDNLGVALTAISLLLTHPSCARHALQDRMTPETVARGIQAVRWPGRLSFHTIPASPADRIPRPLVVLADGAHNPASSGTLGAYITHLLSLINGQDTPRTLTLTYILALSHSPPKTPLQTLAPILPPTLPLGSKLKVKVNVACVTFTPPEGMPWVKCVPPAEVREVVSARVFDADVWVAEEGESEQLVKALEWAARRDGDGEVEGLVIVAGSLYLVADLYRFLSRTRE